jgi:hypothetical protein
MYRLMRNNLCVVEALPESFSGNAEKQNGIVIEELLTGKGAVEAM